MTTCVTVLPSGSTVSEGGSSELGAPLLVGAASYVDAVTDDSDSSYVQQQAAATDYNFITWDLPATNVPYDRLESISVVARIAYDPTQINGRTSVEPSTITNDATARLRYSGDSDSLSVGWASPMPQTITDYTQAFTLGVFPSEVEAWVTALAAGTAQLETRQGGDSIGRCTRHNIYELALLICYEGGTPPLRQNQRDDIRQGQRTSRQLTVRQVGYL